MADSITTRRKDWLSVVWGLLYVREGLQEYVDVKGKQQYHDFMNNVNKKCNNQTCDQCQVNSKCQNGLKKVTGRTPLRQGHFCDEVKEEIANNHVKTPLWINTDSTKWQDPHVGYWEVAKCYLSSSGYMDKTGPNHVGASGLLSICLNSHYIRKHILNIQKFEKVRDIRNKTLHDASYQIDRQTRHDCLDEMIALLEDLPELLNDTFAMKAVDHIKKIRNNTEKTPSMMNEALEKWLQTNFDDATALKEAEEQSYEELQNTLKSFIVEEVQREVQNKFADKAKENDEMKRQQLEQREHNLNELQQKLIAITLEEYSTIPLNPIVQHQDSLLTDFYEPPQMMNNVKKSKRSHTVAQSSISTIEGLFTIELLDNHKTFPNNVYISGEAGMGKTSFVQYLALAWCAVHGDDEMCKRMRDRMKEFKSFNDIEFLKEKKWLFIFHLREYNLHKNCNTMVKTILLEQLGYVHNDLPELMSAISSPETILLMYGLDEWECTSTNMPLFKSVSKPILVYTSRSWKIDSCLNSPRQTYNKITITGIGFDFVERLVRKVTNCLQLEGIPVRDDCDVFNQTLKSEELTKIVSLQTNESGEILMIPVVIILLLCLWHDGKEFGSTRAEIYLNMINTLLYRMRKKENKCYIPSKEAELTTLLFKNIHADLLSFDEDFEAMMKLSKIAFHVLFTNPEEKALAFTECNLNVETKALLYRNKTSLFKSWHSQRIFKEDMFRC